MFAADGAVGAEIVCTAVEFYCMVLVELSIGFYSEALVLLIKVVFFVLSDFVELAFLRSSVEEVFFCSC